MANQFFEASLLDDETKEDLCRELLSEFGVTRIKKTGGGELIHSCCLPFGGHRNGDRNPSASLNYQKLTYRCLGCDSGGGLLWFIAVCRGEDGVQARRWLESQTGTGQQVMDLSKLLQVLNGLFDHATEPVQQIPRFSPSVLDPWTWEVFHPYLTKGVPELGFRGRNIPEETLQHFRIGYTDEYPSGFFDDGTPRLQERVVIPIWWNGDLVGWQARRINEADEHKYRFSVDFPRDRVLFNYQSGTDMVLVESPMSVLRHYHHQPTMAASFGASVTDAQITLLGKAKSLTVWLDNDKAGWKGTGHVINRLSRSVPVFVVESPYLADPADMDDQTVASLIANAVPWAIWEQPSPETLARWEG